MWWNSLCCIDSNFLSKDKTFKQLNKFKNNQIFQIIFNRFYNMALDRYSFEGLPTSMSTRVIKQSLLWNATVYPFQYMGSNIALPGNVGGKFNMYGDISNAFVYGYNGFNTEIGIILPGSEEASVLKQTTFMADNPKEGKGVLVRENDACFPFINVVIYYATQVADALRTLDTQVSHLKTPYLVFCEESQIEDVKRFYKNVKNNEDFIISTGIFPADKVHIEYLNNNGEDINTVISVIEWLTNQYKEVCGITTNANVDKKGENLIQDEIHINEDYTDKNQQSVVDKINEGFSLYNEIFGTNITCVPNKQREENTNDELFGISNNQPKLISKH